MQWGRHLCLYAAPSVEWVPSGGMDSFIERLAAWVVRAAEGTLDPDGQPLHPPVAYPTRRGRRGGGPSRCRQPGPVGCWSR